MEQQDVWRFEQLNFPKTSLNFRLLLAARNQPSGYVTADFGPLDNTSLLPDRNTLAQMAIEHPERMLIWRGEQNRANGNLALAEDFFQRALKIAPDEARANIGLGWTLYDLDKTGDALAQFAQGRDLVNSHPERYDHHDLGETYYGEAFVYLYEGQCASAATAFQTAASYAADFTLPTNYSDSCGTPPVLPTPQPTP
jgi:tetratricopeptide (TPR) repeat protein